MLRRMREKWKYQQVDCCIRSHKHVYVVCGICRGVRWCVDPSAVLLVVMDAVLLRSLPAEWTGFLWQACRFRVAVCE